MANTSSVCSTFTVVQKKSIKNRQEFFKQDHKPNCMYRIVTEEVTKTQQNSGSKAYSQPVSLFFHQTRNFHCCLDYAQNILGISMYIVFQDHMKVRCFSSSSKVSMGSIKIRVTSPTPSLTSSTASTPTKQPLYNEHPSLWLQKCKKKQQIKTIALLAVCRQWMSQYQNKKRENKDKKPKKRMDDKGYGWVENVQAGFNIGIIYKTIVSRHQVKVSRASSKGMQLRVPDMLSKKLHSSRLAISSSLLPYDRNNKEFLQMRKSTLRAASLYYQHQSIFTKDIFVCIMEKGCFITNSNNLTLLASNRSALQRLRLASQGFRSLIAFYSRHLNTVTLDGKLQDPCWRMFQVSSQYDKKYRNGSDIPDSEVPDFFKESFKMSVQLSDKFLYCSLYQKLVSKISFHQFLQITVSLRYDLCYLSKFIDAVQIKEELQQDRLKASVLNHNYSFNNMKEKSKSVLDIKTVDMMKQHGIIIHAQYPVTAKVNPLTRMEVKPQQRNIRKGKYVSKVDQEN